MISRGNIDRMRRSFGYILCVAMILVVKTAWSEIRPSDHATPYVERTERLEQIEINPNTNALINPAANVIVDSCGVLHPVMERLLALRNGADSVVSVLHIGDSHVQAGYWTARIRGLLQESFGDAGRGLIVPHKLAAANEPPNYAIRTSLPYLYNKATSNATNQPLGLSGVGVTFDGGAVELELWSKQGFNAVTVFHHPQAPALSLPQSVDIGSYCTADNTPTSTKLTLSHTVDTLSLKGFTNEEYDNATYYGFSLSNGRPGVLYHAVGSNGAAFEHFSSQTTILQGGAAELHPDLIIISLGTNNCYGNNYKSEHLRNVIKRFVTEVQASYPSAAILLTTPRESCSGSSRRGYRPNPNIADASELIVDVAKERGVAYWDMYHAAGGAGMSEAWYKNNLASRDRIHLTESGYVLLGDMLYNSLAEYYNRWLTDFRGVEIPKIGVDSIHKDSTNKKGAND